jgi:hypothetical protein
MEMEIEEMKRANMNKHDKAGKEEEDRKWEGHWGQIIQKRFEI